MEFCVPHADGLLPDLHDVKQSCETTVAYFCRGVLFGSIDMDANGPKVLLGIGTPHSVALKGQCCIVYEIRQPTNLEEGVFLVL